jgi:protein-tyrosine phosphatase
MKNIYWIRHGVPPKLAIVARPRGGDLLEEDLQALKRDGIDILVSLLTPPEADELGLSNEGAIAKALGLEFVSYPIPDRETPWDLSSFRQLISRLVSAIQAGKSVGAHCRGCIGRSTVVVASVLMELGWTARDALALVERSRECMVPDTVEQRDWIRRYKPAGSVR